MSIVTTIALFCNEEESLKKIDAWLEGSGQEKLCRLNDAFGGSKRPEISAYGSAYNMLDVNALVDLFMELPWEINEETLLVVRHQDSAILTYRPTAYVSASETG